VRRIETPVPYAERSHLLVGLEHHLTKIDLRVHCGYARDRACWLASFDVASNLRWRVSRKFPYMLSRLVGSGAVLRTLVALHEVRCPRCLRRYGLRG